MQQGNATITLKLKKPAVASFTKEVNPRLVKRQKKTNGRLANHGLTSLVKKPPNVQSHYEWHH